MVLPLFITHEATGHETRPRRRVATIGVHLSEVPDGEYIDYIFEKHGRDNDVGEVRLAARCWDPFLLEGIACALASTCNLDHTYRPDRLQEDRSQRER